MRSDSRCPSISGCIKLGHLKRFPNGTASHRETAAIVTDMQNRMDTTVAQGYAPSTELICKGEYGIDQGNTHRRPEGKSRRCRRTGRCESMAASADGRQVR